MGEGEGKRTVLVLDADTLGRGDEELGRLLTVSFLRTVAFRDDCPETVVCYNGGVKLAEQGSPALPMLEALAHKGAEIILCGTCVDYFKLRERLAVGRVGDMRGIVDALMRADRIVSV
jgi:selenium metabolism protein YedF